MPSHLKIRSKWQTSLPVQYLGTVGMTSAKIVENYERAVQFVEKKGLLILLLLTLLFYLTTFSLLLPDQLLFLWGV